MLVAAVLTNDLHYRVFIPAGDAAAMNGETGSYTYGWGYYVICVWISLCLAAGLVLLVRAARRKPGRALPVFLLMWLSACRR